MLPFGCRTYYIWRIKSARQVGRYMHCYSFPRRDSKGLFIAGSRHYHCRQWYALGYTAVHRDISVLPWLASRVRYARQIRATSFPPRWKTQDSKGAISPCNSFRGPSPSTSGLCTASTMEIHCFDSRPRPRGFRVRIGRSKPIRCRV